jgi:hypothetical protein
MGRVTKQRDKAILLKVLSSSSSWEGYLLYEKGVILLGYGGITSSLYFSQSFLVLKRASLIYFLS